jgi:hypothetical protein
MRVCLVRRCVKRLAPPPRMWTPVADFRRLLEPSPRPFRPLTSCLSSRGTVEICSSSPTARPRKPRDMR